MKLFIKYNFDDLTHALDIAKQTEIHADGLIIGSLLIFKEGTKAIEAFKKQFPEKIIFVDAKVADKGQEAVNLFAQAGATYISALAGTYHSIIQNATQEAHKLDAKIVLDFINADSLGQSALEAKALGVDYVLMHRKSAAGEDIDIAGNWQQIKENTNLPILIKGRINKEILEKEILPLKPDGIVVGQAITKSDNPEKAAAEIKALIK